MVAVVRFEEVHALADKHSLVAELLLSATIWPLAVFTTKPLRLSRTIAGHDVCIRLFFILVRREAFETHVFAEGSAVDHIWDGHSPVPTEHCGVAIRIPDDTSTLVTCAPVIVETAQTGG